MPIAIIVFQYLLIRSVDCSNRDLLESYARSTILGSCNCSTATTWLSHVLDRFPQKGRPSHLRKPQLRTRLRGVPAHLGDLGWWQSSQLFLIGKNKNNTNPDRYRTLKSARLTKRKLRPVRMLNRTGQNSTRSLFQVVRNERENAKHVQASR